MARKVALIGCGAAKNPGVLPAKDKYSSNYFRLKRDYGEIVCDDWYIVSAKYGLIDPNQKIDDYDTSITDLERDEVRELTESIDNDLWDILSNDEEIEEETEVHFLMGSSYLDPLETKLFWLNNNPKTEAVYPFEDTSGIGEQMAKLKELTEEARDE